MFNDIVTYPIKSPKLHWQAKEIIKDLESGPHLFIRITLTGTQFPLMAQEPVVKVGRVRSHHVIISEDRLTAQAYFLEKLPAKGIIEFGFGNVMLLRFGQSLVLSKIPRLDRKLLPKDIHLLTKKPK